VSATESEMDDGEHGEEEIEWLHVTFASATVSNRHGCAADHDQLTPADITGKVLVSVPVRCSNPNGAMPPGVRRQDGLKLRRIPVASGRRSPPVPSRRSGTAASRPARTAMK
jgi:hypothetical protein